MTALLEVRDLAVTVGTTVILSDVSITIPNGQLHVLFGPNGSGKSSLLSAIMGLPPLDVSAGEILFKGRCINELTVDERARLGIGIAFQRPPSLDGVTVGGLAKALDAEATLQAEAAALDLGSFASRAINQGFSGGEVKRWEIMKLFLQKPDLLLFDEPESGVDLEHIAAVGGAISRLMNGPDGRRGGLVITHTGFILDYLDADVGHIMSGGRIVHSGNPKALFAHIRNHGYHAPDSQAA